MSVLLESGAHAPATSGWDIVTLQRSPADVHVDYLPGGVRVQVSDGPGPPRPRLASGSTPTWPGSGCTEAWLASDGTAVVRAHDAPPVLLVSGSGARLLPPAPDIDEPVVVAPRDLLVFCSAGVLERLPAGFGTVLSCSSRSVTSLARARLLEDLMVGCRHGAAVIASFTHDPYVGRHDLYDFTHDPYVQPHPQEDR